MKSRTVLSFAFAMLTAMTFGCSGNPKQDAQTALDVNKTVCDALGSDLQNEPDYVKYECVVASAAGGLIKYIAKVPRAQAQRFAAMHARPQQK